MEAPSTIRWVRARETQPVPLPYGSPLLASGDLWPDVKVEEAGSPGASSVPAGSLPATVVVLSVVPAKVTVHWLDDRTQSGWCAPGVTTVLPALAPYRVDWDRQRRSVLAQISPQLFASAAGDGDPSRRIEIRPAFAQDDGFVRNLVLALRDLARRPDAADLVAAETVSAALAAHLALRYGSGPSPTLPRHALSPAQRRELDDYIDARLSSAVSLQALAGLVGMGVFRFARAFKQSVGLSPHQYLLRRRIERARSLLGAGGSSLAETALRCGFSSQSHFTDAFHRLVGVTPGAYRDARSARARIR